MTKSARNQLHYESCAAPSGEAMEREAESRGDMMGDAAAFTVDGVELEQTRKTAVGYWIDGTVNYTLTLAGPEKYPASLRFSCEVLRADDGFTTSVANR
jgi:hypothetical protein